MTKRPIINADVREEATRDTNQQLSLIAPAGVLYAVQIESDDGSDFEMWSGHDHITKVDTDKRLREQEKHDAELARKILEDEGRKGKERHEKDEEVAKKIQEEIDQDARDQVATDTHVAEIYEKLYDRNGEHKDNM